MLTGQQDHSHMLIDWLVGWLAGWLEFNVPFEHKYGYIRDEESHLLTQLHR